MKKSSKNEIRILCILLALLMCYGFYSLLLMPKIESNKTLESQVNNEEILVRSMYDTVANYETNKSSFNENKDTIMQLIGAFYSDTVLQEDFLDLIVLFKDECELHLANLTSTDHENTYTDYDYNNLSPYKAFCEEPVASSPEEVEKWYTGISKNETADAGSVPMLQKMTMDMEYEGTYGNAKKLMQKVKDNDRYILCNSVAFEIPRPEEEEGEEAEEGAEENTAGGTEAESEAEEAVPMTEEEIAEAARQEADSRQVKLTMSLDFIRLSELSSVDLEIAESESAAYPCIAPQEFTSGDYRKIYTLENVTASAKALSEKITGLLPFKK